jgi:hypothetical protein
MRYINITVFIVFTMFLIVGCGDDNEVTPAVTTGTVSGVITFVGTPPAGDVKIEVSIFSKLDENGHPAGPPDFYSDYLTKTAGQALYKISGVTFGTYKLAAVGYKAPDAQPGTPQTILGMYGFNAPKDMEPDSFTVSQEKPEATGIDITADYSAITPPAQ